MEKVPDDILAEILELLSTKDLCSGSLASKRWNRVILKLDIRWQRECSRIWKLNPRTQISNLGIIGVHSWKFVLQTKYQNVRSSKERNKLFSHLSLTFYPSSIFLNTQLDSLQLCHNLLTVIPPQISTLSNLRNIYLGYNFVELLAEELFCLTQLQILSIPSNRLSFISNSIIKLKNLHTLDISFNSLSKIPDALGSLPSISRLDISENRIEVIPLTIRQRSDIKITATGNPLKELPILEQFQNTTISGI